MSEKAKLSREEKAQKLFEFALSMRHDPDFHRLVFPPDVLAKLADMGAAPAPKEYSAAAAIDRCFNMKGTERYTSNEIEIIDQSKMEITFPAIPPVAEPEKETDTLTLVEETKEEVSREEESPVKPVAEPVPSEGPGVP